MSCENETISAAFRCLQNLCFERSTVPSDCGSVAATSTVLSILFTGLLVAGVSAAIHVVLHIWFYKPRMAKKDEEDHHYEDIQPDGDVNPIKGPNKARIAIELKSNKAYQWSITRAVKKKNNLKSDSAI